MQSWLVEKQEQFGAQWQRVASILTALRRIGIHLLDINPGNIAF